MLNITQQLWDVFQTTGKITDYLAYADQKGNDQENYDNQRCCPVPESTG
ncbi:MAG: hypothetical protein K2G25_11320 [Oscillospiraceae bacterium]|nr:hypothetical protein [Oscillospiraceae bacterium]